MSIIFQSSRRQGSRETFKANNENADKLSLTQFSNWAKNPGVNDNDYHHINPICAYRMFSENLALTRASFGSGYSRLTSIEYTLNPSSDGGGNYKKGVNNTSLRPIMDRSLEHLFGYFSETY